MGKSVMSAEEQQVFGIAFSAATPFTYISQVALT
jgi:hypothetical protein